MSGERETQADKEIEMIVARKTAKRWIKSGRVIMLTGVTDNDQLYIACDDILLQRVVHFVATVKDVQDHPELFN